MTDQVNGTGPGGPVADLQPLAFLQKDDNGTESTYQAQINNADADYTLTVTMASPGQDKQQVDAISQFLKDMRAKFELAAPVSGVDLGGGQGPVSFDVNTGILIEPDLVRVNTGTGLFGITMTLQTTVESDSGEPAAGAFDIRGVVLRGKSHTYTSRHGRATATVTGLGGSGWISSPDKNINTIGACQSDSGRTVTVHGYTRFLYNLAGTFY